MVNVDEWDADDRNEDKDNDLERYLDALSRQQQQLVKGIKAREAGRYLRMKEEDFRNQLKDSLTLTELSKLSKPEKQLRDRLIVDIMAVWRRQKEDIEQFEKDWKQRQEYNVNKSAEGWVPKHHDKPLDEFRDKKLSVSQAARLHEGKNVTVRGILSGVQPLRKMIKGVTVECIKCGKAWVKKYDKPELNPSVFLINQIRICLGCKSSKYLETPKYDKINAVVAELKDENTFSEIDPIQIVVFGDDEPAFDNTLDIERHLGELIEVSGDIYSIDTAKTKYDSKVVVFLYVKHLVNYLQKQEIEITGEDVKAIQRFVRLIGSNNVVNKLTDMFATSVIGHTAIKKGLVLCAASTSLNKKVMKLNTILVGDVGLAKSLLLKNGVGIVPGSRYENIQFATGKSLTAIVSKDEGGAITLRTGPIPQAKGAIAALNEIGLMQFEEQGYLLDIMEEQEFTTNKHGRWFHIDAPTAIMASGNPIGGSWKSNHNDVVSVDKIPAVKPLLDRFPLTFIFRDDRSEKGLHEFAVKKSEMQTRPRPEYIPYIQKHILYAKQRYPKPKLSEDARSMLNQYYVGVRVKHGSPRIWNTVQRIAETNCKSKTEK
jgi:replicative DNA helicase Mcm